MSPPLLLLGMQEEQATVLPVPSANGYGARCTRPSGEKLPIPAPFDGILDMTGFKTP
ncbi:hypothetical protein ABTY20_30870 [Streptomyces sp. NPDC126497]|uniref:hypothetical protein n=1 Tax=Streptomyces sp. NPDC126497 TaxID=3155313 RepID=UPI00331F3265